MWSEFRPAGAPVVMDAVGGFELADLGGRQRSRLVKVQRRELGGTEGIEVAGGQGC